MIDSKKGLAKKIVEKEIVSMFISGKIA